MRSIDKQTCRTCRGTGMVRTKARGKKPYKAPCPVCGGRGKGYATK